MIEYDETLGQDLVSAGFDAEKIVSYSMAKLFDISSYDYGPIYQISEKIACARQHYSSGCIWVMPISTNHSPIVVNGMHYTLSSRKSAQEIRKIIAMKAFL